MHAVASPPLPPPAGVPRRGDPAAGTPWERYAQPARGSPAGRPPPRSPPRARFASPALGQPPYWPTCRAGLAAVPSADSPRPAVPPPPVPPPTVRASPPPLPGPLAAAGSPRAASPEPGSPPRPASTCEPPVPWGPLCAPLPALPPPPAAAEGLHSPGAAPLSLPPPAPGAGSEHQGFGVGTGAGAAWGCQVLQRLQRLEEATFLHHREAAERAAALGEAKIGAVARRVSDLFVRIERCEALGPAHRRLEQTVEAVQLVQSIQAAAVQRQLAEREALQEQPAPSPRAAASPAPAAAAAPPPEPQPPQQAACGTCEKVLELLRQQCALRDALAVLQGTVADLARRSAQSPRSPPPAAPAEAAPRAESVRASPARPSPPQRSREGALAESVQRAEGWLAQLEGAQAPLARRVAALEEGLQRAAAGAAGAGQRAAEAAEAARAAEGAAEACAAQLSLGAGAAESARRACAAAEQLAPRVARTESRLSEVEAAEQRIYAKLTHLAAQQQQQQQQPACQLERRLAACERALPEAAALRKGLAELRQWVQDCIGCGGTEAAGAGAAGRVVSPDDAGSPAAPPGGRLRAVEAVTRALGDGLREEQVQRAAECGRLRAMLSELQLRVELAATGGETPLRSAQGSPLALPAPVDPRSLPAPVPARRAPPA